MTAATELWAAVEAVYDADGLVSLTNIRDRSGTAVDDTVGQTAAQSVIDLWGIYAEIDYDSTDAAHVEVATEGVIALLWRRGGSATTIEQVKWGEVFGADGMVSKVRGTGPRGRQGPSSNSGVTQKTEQTASGGRFRGWADRESLPPGYLPNRITASDT